MLYNISIYSTSLYNIKSIIYSNFLSKLLKHIEYNDSDENLALIETLFIICNNITNSIYIYPHLDSLYSLFSNIEVLIINRVIKQSFFNCFFLWTSQLQFVDDIEYSTMLIFAFDFIKRNSIQIIESESNINFINFVYNLSLIPNFPIKIREIGLYSSYPNLLDITNIKTLLLFMQLSKSEINLIFDIKFKIKRLCEEKEYYTVTDKYIHPLIFKLLVKIPPGFNYNCILLIIISFQLTRIENFNFLCKPEIVNYLFSLCSVYERIKYVSIPLLLISTLYKLYYYCSKHDLKDVLNIFCHSKIFSILISFYQRLIYEQFNILV